MNRENFADYLRNPSRLYQLPLAELRSLLLEYPYSPNLRLLLLLKAQQDGDARTEQILESTAATTFDRSFLRQQLETTLEVPAPPTPEHVNGNEEVLELKDLRELIEWEPSESLSPQAAISEQSLTFFPEEIPPTSEGSPPSPAAAELPKQKENLPVSPPERHPSEPEPPATTEPPSETVDVSQARLEEVLPEAKTLPTSDDLLDQLPAHKDQLNRQIEARKRQAIAKVRQHIRRSAPPPPPRSEAEGSLITETLADLMVRQGHIKQAIAAYSQLSLLFPEKSRYFAGIIEDLRQQTT